MVKNEQNFKALLAEQKLKFTSERKAIFEEIQTLKKHFDADELYAILQERGLKVSRDTVYRTLPLLLQCGIIQKSVGDGRREYFEPVGKKGHHDHMVCIECGKVIEFHSDKLENLQDKICKEHGFKLRFHDHRLFGHCRNCQ